MHTNMSITHVVVRKRNRLIQPLSSQRISLQTYSKLPELTMFNFFGQPLKLYHGIILQCKNLKNTCLRMSLAKLKSHSDTTALLEVLHKCSGHLFWRNFACGCFWTEEIQLPRT